MSFVELRPTPPEDLPWIVALENDPEAARFITAESLGEHQRLSTSRDAFHLSIWRDGTAVGYLLLVLDGDGHSVELRRIVVARRGQGIGQAALRAAEHWIVARLGRGRVWLDVFLANERGRHVYGKLGYREFKREMHARGMQLFLDKELPA
ncbi:MAG: GNAT family N-acetyltransferase [Myxococcales bacterium FL481]|nr:MAG: GNAT family N-acetyltransferase [Myxococcales bacterium FL481]